MVLREGKHRECVRTENIDMDLGGPEVTVMGLSETEKSDRIGILSDVLVLRAGDWCTRDG